MILNNDGNLVAFLSQSNLRSIYIWITDLSKDNSSQLFSGPTKTITGFFPISSWYYEKWGDYILYIVVFKINATNYILKMFTFKVKFDSLANPTSYSIGAGHIGINLLRSLDSFSSKQIIKGFKCNGDLKTDPFQIIFQKTIITYKITLPVTKQELRIYTPPNSAKAVHYHLYIETVSNADYAKFFYFHKIY